MLFLSSACIKMSHNQLAPSSSGRKCGRQHGQTVSDSINSVRLFVGIAESRFVFVVFRDVPICVLSGRDVLESRSRAESGRDAVSTSGTVQGHRSRVPS